MSTHISASLFVVAALLGQVRALPAETLANTPPTATSNPLRNAYFGDLHLHTGLSFDAYMMAGVTTTPEDAYRFARGETVKFMGKEVHRKEPLDFMAVTDHAEYIGFGLEMQNAQSPLAKSDIGRRILSGDPGAFGTLVQLIASGGGIPGVNERVYEQTAWQMVIDAANKYYDPGHFTTLIGYEWTSFPNQQNLHRNVIFRGETAPFPFSAVDSRRPEDLWTYLETNRKRGVEALAIPHNGNASNGLMYDWNDSEGRSIDQSYAMRRALNEPLTEISQGKGQSETHPSLSPNDEFSGFEVFDYLLVGRTKSKVHGSYVREAYGRGLVIAHRTGVNPYKFGVVGGSDFHGGLSTSSEDSYAGSPIVIAPVISENQVKANLASPVVNVTPLPNILTHPGNLTGVWAESNTRDSIYDALKRKETFATTGTRIKLRFFGGWEFPGDLQSNDNWIETAYRRGVAMGGDLPARAAKGQHPRFAVWAVKDPGGANLDRVQIVKIWFKPSVNGKTAEDNFSEKVFDVVWSAGRLPDPKTGRVPPVGDTVDLRTATYVNSIGATELKTVWVDPEFDPSVSAVYYLRVLEIPTPRWSTITAVKYGLPLSQDVPPSIQERGWSSPIWYLPRQNP